MEKYSKEGDGRKEIKVESTTEDNRHILTTHAGQDKQKHTENKWKNSRTRRWTTQGERELRINERRGRRRGCLILETGIKSRVKRKKQEWRQKQRTKSRRGFFIRGSSWLKITISSSPQVYFLSRNEQQQERNSFRSEAICSDPTLAVSRVSLKQHKRDKDGGNIMF